MAGRAAIEIVTGQVDLGASNDLLRARDMIENSHKTCAPDDFMTLTTDIYRDPEAQRELRIRYTAFELDKYYKDVKELIVKNRQYLDAIIRELLEKETLTQRELKILFAQKQSVSAGY